MNTIANTSHSLAADITKKASKQTYFTIRFFADRDRVDDAYRAYAYFRWVDDVLDSKKGSRPEKIAFVQRQKSILENCYLGQTTADLCAQEWMLVYLIRNDTNQKSGLHSYLQNMMDVMVFDTKRRGELINQKELSDYSRKLAIAVTEAMHYFIGNDNPTPRHEARYLAVTAAHVTHMLRDTIEDTRIGYYNIPSEYTESHKIEPREVESQAYRDWVSGRVQLARMYFRASRDCIAQVKNLRCRLAGFAYAARFEWMLGAIERDRYCLRAKYRNRKSLLTGLWICWKTMVSFLNSLQGKVASQTLAVQPVRVKTYEN